MLAEYKKKMTVNRSLADILGDKEDMTRAY